MRVRARVAFLFLGALATASGARGDAALASRLEASLRHPGLQGAKVSALVVRADDGTTLFDRDAGRALVPASNLKILTALAALESLGPSHRFTTRVWADRAPDAEGAVGWLAVEGGGDPSLTSEQWWRLAADLQRAGLRRVDGAILLDDTAFDDRRWHSKWGNISSRAYHAPVSALAANFGAFAVEVRPGSASGSSAWARVDPPVSTLRLQTGVRTRGARTPAKLLVDRVAQTEAAETWIVRGAVPQGGEPETVWRSVADPVLYAGGVLRMQLEAVGVSVGGPLRPAAVPADAVELLDFEGDSLGRVVGLFMKYSSNPIGEMLVKGLGRAATGEAGSWKNGRRAVRASLERLGLDLSGFQGVDGSGLARANRVAPRTLVQALQVARDSFRFGPELMAALPIAARDGTLKERMEGSPDGVRAKTGLLDGVTALSGYADSPHGVLVFSVISNGHTRGDEPAMDALDGFAAALSRRERAAR